MIYKLIYSALALVTQTASAFTIFNNTQLRVANPNDPIIADESSSNDNLLNEIENGIHKRDTSNYAILGSIIGAGLLVFVRLTYKNLQNMKKALTNVSSLIEEARDQDLTGSRLDEIRSAFERLESKVDKTINDIAVEAVIHGVVMGDDAIDSPAAPQSPEPPKLKALRFEDDEISSEIIASEALQLCEKKESLQP